MFEQLIKGQNKHIAQKQTYFCDHCAVATAYITSTDEFDHHLIGVNAAPTIIEDLDLRE